MGLGNSRAKSFRSVTRTLTYGLFDMNDKGGFNEYRHSESVNAGLALPSWAKLTCLLPG
jgi:hypothetical protein